MSEANTVPASPPSSGRAYSIRVIGAARPSASDLYHSLLRVPWWGALGVIVVGYLALNAVFAGLYLLAGGVANAERTSLADAFFFSVQTMGTIGYGSMYPVSRAANALVVAESVTGLVVTALATGLVFVRFSQTRARVLFSRRVAIAPMDGVPTLMVRVGNERSNLIYEAVLRLGLVRTTRTAEGVLIYRSEDLPLVRERAAALTRSWMILHRIDARSPLHGATPESLAEAEAELLVTLAGTDDTSLQPVHARHSYADRDVVWGARLADVLSETPDGDMLLDLARFHDLTPSTPTPDFPYPRAAGAAPPGAASDPRRQT